jgi:CheY-like chemotaxis protein
LSLELDGEPGPPIRDLVGLSWLQEQVGRARGMLELCLEPGGSLWPQVYLPTQDRSPRTQTTPLLARTVWIVDQDPLVREALSQLIRREGGDVEAFEDLKQLIRASRDQRPPDLLVLEHTPLLERFQKAIRAFQREPIPTLVVGDGQGVPLPPNGLGGNRIGFIQKPFDGQDFIQALLGLLQALRRPTG